MRYFVDVSPPIFGVELNEASAVSLQPLAVFVCEISGYGGGQSYFAYHFNASEGLAIIMQKCSQSIISILFAGSLLLLLLTLYSPATTMRLSPLDPSSYSNARKWMETTVFNRDNAFVVHYLLNYGPHYE